MSAILPPAHPSKHVHRVPSILRRLSSMRTWAILWYIYMTIRPQAQYIACASTNLSQSYFQRIIPRRSIRAQKPTLSGTRGPPVRSAGPDGWRLRPIPGTGNGTHVEYAHNRKRKESILDEMAVRVILNEPNTQNTPLFLAGASQPL